MTICISPLDSAWAFNSRMSIYFATLILLLPVPRSFLLWRASAYYMVATTVVATIYIITQLVELKTNSLRAIPIDLLIAMEACTLAMIPPARSLISGFGQHSGLRKYMRIWAFVAALGGIIGCIVVDSLSRQAAWSPKHSTDAACLGQKVPRLGFLLSSITPKNEIAQIRIYLICVFAVTAAVCLGVVLLVQSEERQSDTDSEVSRSQASCWRLSTVARAFVLLVFDLVSLALALVMIIPTEQLLSRLNLASDRQFGSARGDGTEWMVEYAAGCRG